ncbi:MAG: YfiR family protein [Opitutaceae bacterium]|nr:YfiR family protein [Opitutaceae bacterium]
MSEAELKAAFVPKFPLFVQWPAAAAKPASLPLVIGVLDGAEIMPHLEALVTGRSVGGRPLSLKVCRDAREARQCHIVFLGSGDAGRIQEVLRQLEGASVLTVSDAPDFASQGGMVNLVTTSRRVRLEVNLDAIQRVALRIDPQLLQMARVVKTAAPPSP